MLDWTISVGTIIQTILLGAAIIGGLLKIYERIGKIESKVDTMWIEFSNRVLKDKNGN